MEQRGTVRERESESESESECEDEDEDDGEDADQVPDVRREVIEGRIKCLFCDRTFSWRKSCVRHEATHGGSPTFRCTSCDKGFTRHDGLRMHRCPVARQAKVARTEELAEKATQLESQLAETVREVQAARRDLADKTSEMIQLTERLAAAQRALEAPRDVEDGVLLYAPAPLVLEQAFGPRGQRCRACLHVLDAVTGAAPRGCHTCGLLFHSRCIYFMELDPTVELFCVACLRKHAIKARTVEAASFEAVGLPRALAERNMRLSKSPANGACLFAASAEGTQGLAGDARALMVLAGECLLKLVAFVATPVQADEEDADLQHWRYTFNMSQTDQPEFAALVKKAAVLLAKGKSVEGSGWNTAAMDLVPQVLPWLIGREVHVWAFNYVLRDLPPKPQEFEVRRIPDHREPTTRVKRPLLLARSKEGMLPHYDLILLQPKN